MIMRVLDRMDCPLTVHGEFGRMVCQGTDHSSGKDFMENIFLKSTHLYAL